MTLSLHAATAETTTRTLDNNNNDNDTNDNDTNDSPNEQEYEEEEEDDDDESLSLSLPPIVITNDATLREQKDRLVQALCGSVVAYEGIVRQPTAATASLLTWRAGLLQQPERWQRHAQVILIVLLEDIIRNRRRRRQQQQQQDDNDEADNNLTWQHLERAWRTLLAPSSALHLVVNANALQFGNSNGSRRLSSSSLSSSWLFMEPTPGIFSTGAGNSLWNLTQRIHDALVLHALPIVIGDASVDEGRERPTKRRRCGAVMGPPPTQQAVTLVILAFLAVVDQTTTPVTVAATTNSHHDNAAQWTDELPRRWSVLTAGWTKLEEAIWLAAWNHVLQQPTGGGADVATVQTLLQQLPEESTWLLWSRITGLPEDVAVAVWAERLAWHANQSDHAQWWNVLQRAMTWWDPMAKFVHEQAHQPGAFGVAGSAATTALPFDATHAADLFETQIPLLTRVDPGNVAKNLERLSIPAYADMVYAVLALHRNLWQITLELAARLESRHGKTHPVAWVLYQFLFEFFAKNGTLLDWPLGARQARKTWINEFQWRVGNLGRECFAEGFELVGQQAPGSLLRDVCLYAVTRLQETQPWLVKNTAPNGVTKRPVLTAEQRVAMDERVIQALAGRRPLTEVEAAVAVQNVALAVQDKTAEDETDEIQVPDQEEEEEEEEEEEPVDKEETTKPVAVARHYAEESSDNDAVETKPVNEYSEGDDEGHDDDAMYDETSSEESPSIARRGSKEEDAIEVFDESEEEEEEQPLVETESFSHQYIRNGEEKEHYDSGIHDDENHEEEPHESEEEAEDYGSDEEELQDHESDDGQSDTIVYETGDDDDDEQAVAEAMAEEVEGQEGEAIRKVQTQHDDVILLDDDGAETDVSEDAGEDIRAPVAREPFDGDENYYATAEESQDDEDIVQALSQDESNEPSSHNFRLPVDPLREERHVRIKSPIQRLPPAPGLDDGYVPSDKEDHTEDEMPAPPVRVHHERDGYQGGESSLCHTEDDEEEISEAAEDEEEIAHVARPTENGTSTSQVPPALDSHSLSGMSAADELGPEEESSELEEANESDQVHFPVTQSYTTTVHPANASLEDYAAAAARQESSAPHKPQNRQSSDTTNRLSIASPEILSLDELEDQGLSEPSEKSERKPSGVPDSEIVGARYGIDDGGDEGTVMGPDAEDSLDQAAAFPDGTQENQQSIKTDLFTSKDSPIGQAMVDSGEIPISADVSSTKHATPHGSRVSGERDEVETKDAPDVSRECLETKPVDVEGIKQWPEEGLLAEAGTAEDRESSLADQEKEEFVHTNTQQIPQETELRKAAASDENETMLAESIEATDDTMRVEQDPPGGLNDPDAMAMDEKDAGQINDEQSIMFEDAIASPTEPASMATDRDESVVDPMVDDDDANDEVKMDDGEDEVDAMAVDEGEAMAIEDEDKLVDDVEMERASDGAGPIVDEEMEDGSGELVRGQDKIVPAESTMAVDETVSSEPEVPALPEGGEDAKQEEATDAIGEDSVDKQPPGLTAATGTSLEPIPEEKVPSDDQEPTTERVDLDKASVAGPASLSTKKQESAEKTNEETTETESEVPLKSSRKRKKDDASTATPSKPPARRSTRSTAGKRSATDTESVGSVSTRSRGRSKKTDDAEVPPKTPKTSRPPRHPKSVAAKTAEKDGDSVTSRLRSASKKQPPADSQPHGQHDDDMSVLTVNTTESAPLETKPRTRKSTRLAQSDQEEESISTTPSRGAGSRKSTRSAASSTAASRPRRGKTPAAAKTPDTTSTKRTTRSSKKVPEKEVNEDSETKEKETKKARPKRTTRSSSKATAKEEDGDESSKKDRSKKHPPSPTRKLRSRK